MNAMGGTSATPWTDGISFVSSSIPFRLIVADVVAGNAMSNWFFNFIPMCLPGNWTGNTQTSVQPLTFGSSQSQRYYGVAHRCSSTRQRRSQWWRFIIWFRCKRIFDNCFRLRFHSIGRWNAANRLRIEDRGSRIEAWTWSMITFPLQVYCKFPSSSSINCCCCGESWTCRKQLTITGSISLTAWVSAWPAMLEIQNHSQSLTTIESDSYDLQPVMLTHWFQRQESAIWFRYKFKL